MKKNMPNMPKLTAAEQLAPAVNVPVAEETELEHGARAAALHENEGGESDDGHGEQRQDEGRRPAVVVRLDKGVGEGAQSR